MATSEAPELLTIQEVAAQLKVPVATIRRWRTYGKAPRAVAIGKHIRFTQSDVNAWLAEQSDRVGA